MICLQFQWLEFISMNIVTGIVGKRINKNEGYLEKPLDDVMFVMVTSSVIRVFPPIIFIDFSQSTKKILRYKTIVIPLSKFN